MATTAANILTSIRGQIPDIVSNITTDGAAFSLSLLLLWLNDAMRALATAAPVIIDWTAIQSTSGMDAYVLPDFWVTTEQAWFDLLPCTRVAEIDDIFTTKITGRSWWFAPHSSTVTPVIHMWPACNRTGSTTTLNGNIGATDTTITLTDSSGFNTMGFFTIGTELVRYMANNTTTGVMTNILRGQGGTVAAAHLTGAVVTENNIMLKGSRLPIPLVDTTSLIEIPQGLWPLLELYVIAKVREAEQDSGTAIKLRQEFYAACEKLGNKSQFKGTRQGLQIRISPAGPNLFGGRLYIP